MATATHEHDHFNLGIRHRRELSDSLPDGRGCPGDPRFSRVPFEHEGCAHRCRSLAASWNETPPHCKESHPGYGDAHPNRGEIEHAEGFPHDLCTLASNDYVW